MYRKYIQFFHFILSGLTAAFTEFTSFLLIRELIGSIYIANSASFGAGLLVSFGLNKIFVFKSRNGKTHREFTLYLILALINLIVSNAVLGLLVYLGLNALLAKFLVMGFIASYNYLIFSRIIFKKSI